MKRFDTTIHYALALVLALCAAAILTGCMNDRTLPAPGDVRGEGVLASVRSRSQNCCFSVESARARVADSPPEITSWSASNQPVPTKL